MIGRAVFRLAQVRGLLGGSRGWTAVWTAMLVARLLRRVAGDRPEVVLREPILPGETLVITGSERSPRVVTGRRRVRRS